VLAYEVLTGVPPFTAPSAVQLVSAHMMRPPDPLTRHRPEIPEALEEIVLRCLAKRPAERFQRAEEIVEKLDALLTGPLSEMMGTTQEHAVAPSKFRIAEGLARRLDRQVSIRAWSVIRWNTSTTTPGRTRWSVLSPRSGSMRPSTRNTCGCFRGGAWP
jgi:serine/threonine protein kinase